MSTQHATQLPHLLQKEPATFVREAEKLVRFYKIYKFENSACRGPNQQTQAGGWADLFLFTGECTQKWGRGCPQLLPLSSYHLNPVGSVISSAAAQQRGQSRRRSGWRWADSLRQPVERAEGLRDEGQESPARISPVLPVWGGVLQMRVSGVASVRPETSNCEQLSMIK